MGIRAFLARHFSRRCRPEGWITRRLARKLDLDSYQEARLRAVQDSLRTLRHDAQEGWAYQRQALAGLLNGEQLNREEALRLARVPMAMVNDALPHAIERFADFYDALAPDQRTRLRELTAGSRCGSYHCAPC
jgi:hypothetical protein